MLNVALYNEVFIAVHHAFVTLAKHPMNCLFRVFGESGAICPIAAVLQLSHGADLSNAQVW
jgi:hypothetical protein